MKIGFVIDDSLDKSDGVQQYVLTLGHWFQSEGHIVHYLAGHTERTDISHIHSLSKNLQVHFNQNRMSTPLPADKDSIRNLLAEEEFDVLHVQMPYSPFLAARIIKSASSRTAIIGTFHIIPFSWVERIATRLLGLVLRGTLKRFDSIYSVSAPAKSFARQAFGIKSDILPNVVNLSLYQSAKPISRLLDQKINIVFLGRLVERKGCLHLLKALNALKEAHHLERVRVIICGKGPMENMLKKYVSENKLSKIVHFAGYVSEKEKADYLATADITVLPSTGGESFGIVLIEAMAAGSDVVLAGDNVGYRSVIGDRDDQLINPTDTKEFAKKLKHFIDSSGARKKTKTWQMNHVKQYDVRLVGKQLIEAYEVAIAKKLANNDNKA